MGQLFFVISLEGISITAALICFGILYTSVLTASNLDFTNISIICDRIEATAGITANFVLLVQLSVRSRIRNWHPPQNGSNYARVTAQVTRFVTPQLRETIEVSSC